MKLNTQPVLLAIVTGSSLAAPIPGPGFSFKPEASKPSNAVSKSDAPGGTGGSGSGTGTSSAAVKTDKDGKEKEPFSKVKFYEDHGTKINGGLATVAGGVAIGAAWTNHEADEIQRQTDAKTEATKQKEEAKANGNGGAPAARRSPIGSFRAPSRANSKPPSRQGTSNNEPANVPLPPSRTSTVDSSKYEGPSAAEKGKVKASDTEPRPASVLSQTPGASGSTPHTSSSSKPEEPKLSSGAQSKEDEEKKQKDRKKSVNGAQNAAAGTVGAVVGLTGGAIILDNAINKKEDNQAKAAKADAEATKADAQRRSPAPAPLDWAQAGMGVLSMGMGGGDLVGVRNGRNSVTQQALSQGSRHTGAKSRRRSAPDADLLQKRLGFNFDKSDNSQTSQVLQQGDSHTGASSGGSASLFDAGNGSARPPSSGRKHASGSASSSKYDRRELAQLLFA